jgi:hypothetical protein
VIIEKVVYIAIGWLSITTVLFMFLILNLNRIEVRNSKRALNMKLAMHYNHQYHKMRIAFEKYFVFKTYHPKVAGEMVKIFNDHSSLINKSIHVLSDEINMNCVNNQFVFIESKALRSMMTLKSKDIVELYHLWVDLLKTFETSSESRRAHEHYDETLITETYHQINMTYNKMIEQVIEMYALLSNETYQDILKIKKALS